MYRSSEFKKNSYKTGEVAKILGVTTRTIQNYDIQKKLKIGRSATNQRVILKKDLLDYLDKQGLLFRDDIKEKNDVIYARVSGNDQKQKCDLDRQALFLVENVSNLINPVIIKEVGSGLNDKRPQLLKLIKMVMDGNVRNIYVTYKDRLTRFGFNYLETICMYNDVKIIVVKDGRKEKSVQEELVEDMMSLIACFSGKLYGLRSKRKNNIKKEV